MAIGIWHFLWRMGKARWVCHHSPEVAAPALISNFFITDQGIMLFKHLSCCTHTHTCYEISFDGCCWLSLNKTKLTSTLQIIHQFFLCHVWLCMLHMVNWWINCQRKMIQCELNIQSLPIHIISFSPTNLVLSCPYLHQYFCFSYKIHEVSTIYITTP